MSPDALLEIRDLSVRLGDREPLHGIALTVLRHELHAIVGPNGAGKSTLLRAVLGELPHRGEIRFHGSGTGVIGYVPQTLHLPRDVPLTVLDFLRLNLDPRPLVLPPSRATRERCRAVLARTHAEDLLHRPVARLSGGQFRRVLIAQALEPAPELLVLDEPFANLDDGASRWLEGLLRDLPGTRGVTVLLVAHDAPLVERLGASVTRLTGTGTVVRAPGVAPDRTPETGSGITLAGAPEAPADGVRSRGAAPAGAP